MLETLTFFFLYNYRDGNLDNLTLIFFGTTLLEQGARAIFTSMLSLLYYLPCCHPHKLRQYESDSEFGGEHKTSVHLMSCDEEVASIHRVVGARCNFNTVWFYDSRISRRGSRVQRDHEDRWRSIFARPLSGCFPRAPLGARLEPGGTSQAGAGTRRGGRVHGKWLKSKIKMAFRKRLAFISWNSTKRGRFLCLRIDFTVHLHVSPPRCSGAVWAA